MKLLSTMLITGTIIAAHASYANNKIIYFISTPRSLSVAFTRMMQQRGDFSIFHEPSQCAFNTITWPDLAKKIYRDNAPTTYDAVAQTIEQESLQKPVFIKEMVIAAQEFLNHDTAFITNPDVYCIFLVRNPHPVVISYCKNSIALPGDLADRIGCKAAYKLLQFAQEKAVNKPLLILTEDLYTKPAETVQAFCDHVGIPYNEQAMQWSDLGADFDGAQEWHEHKHKELVHRWHGDAIHSTGFSIPTQYDVDEKGNPTFVEARPEWRVAIQHAYTENIPYYQLLLEQARKLRTHS